VRPDGGDADGDRHQPAAPKDQEKTAAQTRTRHDAQQRRWKMTDHRIVSRDEWLSARRGLLAKEKEFLRLRDDLSSQRRDLPWVRVDKRYVFATPQGPQTLAELFGSHSQLIVCHLMFAPESDACCKSCAFWADSYNGVTSHLAQRDVAFTAISRAPL